VLAHAHGADDGSTHRAFIRDHSDLFTDVSSLSDDMTAARISEDEVDILVSYDGMHDFNSMKVLLRHPACIQMTWLGFAATTGFRPGQGVHYAIADAVIAASDSVGEHFSEKLVFLPEGYQPQDEWQGVRAAVYLYLCVRVFTVVYLEAFDILFIMYVLFGTALGCGSVTGRGSSSPLLTPRESFSEFLALVY
jgi:hypothetical protein